MGPPLWAAKYIEIPFVPRGHDFSGCNCWGLVSLVYRQEYGIKLDTYLDILSTDRPAIRQAMNSDHSEDWCKVTGPRIGDVIWLRIEGMPFHTGIVVDRYTMMHTMEGVGVAIERYDSILWKSKVLGFFRHDKRA